MYYRTPERKPLTITESLLFYKHIDGARHILLHERGTNFGFEFHKIYVLKTTLYSALKDISTHVNSAVFYTL